MSQRAESADTVLAPAGAVIFCRVIDNFGDAGVTWRLSKRLRDLGLPVTLVIDAVDVLARLVHDLDPAATDALVRGIRIADWDAFEAEVSAGDLSRIGGVWPSLVFETFGCRLPDAVEAGLCDGRTRLWVNLDYLSAEEWVEGSHMVWGLHPTLPVKKLWFFPGFTDRTGGLLIEDGLDEARRAFDAAAWRRAHGARDGLRTLFFFVYPVNAIDRLAAGLRAAGEPLNLMLAPGEASDMLERALKGDARGPEAGGKAVDRVDGVGEEEERAKPVPCAVRPAPFVPQEEFDDILRAVDGAVIRGEDSFVRAQLAGTPLLWATYPTEDKAHEIKLDAWLARFREAWPADAAVPFETYEAASRHWVDGTLEPAEVKAWLDQLPVQKRAAEVWRESLLRRGDLARRILELVPRA